MAVSAVGQTGVSPAELKNHQARRPVAPQARCLCSLSAPRFSGILMKDVNITVFDPRRAPCDYITPR